MQTFHTFASAVPNDSNPSRVGSSRWNDVHQTGAVVTAFNASGVVPTTVDYIRGTGGGSGIALQLTSRSQQFIGASGTFSVNQVYYAKKVDSGAGAVTFTDLNGATFEGAASYSLTQQGQWAIFIWNGTSWDVFGGQAA